MTINALRYCLVGTCIIVLTLTPTVCGYCLDGKQNPIADGISGSFMFFFMVICVLIATLLRKEIQGIIP